MQKRIFIKQKILFLFEKKDLSTENDSEKNQEF